MPLRLLLALIGAVALTTPVVARSPRDTLIVAAFDSRDAQTALALIAAADRDAAATLARAPGNAEAVLVRAMALGYRAKLKRSRGDALAARKQFEAIVAADPRNAEARMVIAGWHLDAIADLGGFVAKTALGADRKAGLAALDRAVALAPLRAAFPALACIMRIRLDPKDVGTARRLAELAARTPAPTLLDRVLQRRVAGLMAPLAAGEGKRAAALARTLLPLGRIGNRS